MARGIRDDDGDDACDLGPARLKKVTTAAIIVVPVGDNDAFDGELIVPKSQIHENSEVYVGMDGDEGKLIVTAWWAGQRGLA